jgi:hypothetical protein
MGETLAPIRQGDRQAGPQGATGQGAGAMVAELDLFVEPKTCGSCGACIAGSLGTFCDLSLKAITGEGEGCGWWFRRLDISGTRDCNMIQSTERQAVDNAP